MVERKLSTSLAPRRSRRRRSVGAAVLCGALLGNLLDDGLLLLDTVAGRDRRAMFGSIGQLERVVEHLAGMRESVRAMPVEQRANMPDIDWQSWERLTLHPGGAAQDWRELLWRTVIELVPATVEAARGYQAPREG